MNDTIFIVKLNNDSEEWWSIDDGHIDIFYIHSRCFSYRIISKFSLNNLVCVFKGDEGVLKKYINFWEYGKLSLGVCPWKIYTFQSKSQIKKNQFSRTWYKVITWLIYPQPGTSLTSVPLDPVERQMTIKNHLKVNIFPLWLS